jgi:hypothetical protein
MLFLVFSTLLEKGKNTLLQKHFSPSWEAILVLVFPTGITNPELKDLRSKKNN